MKDRVEKRPHKKGGVLNSEKFNENPVQEMLRLRPDKEPSFTALDYLKEQGSIDTFLKSYEEYLNLNITNKEEIKFFGSAKNIAIRNIQYFLAWRQDSGSKLEMWSNALHNFGSAPGI